MFSGSGWFKRFGNGQAKPAPGKLRGRGLFSSGVKRGRRAVVDARRGSVFESAGAVLEPGPRLVPAASWAYQLQSISVETIAGSTADVVVIDSSADGSTARAFTKADVAQMRGRAGARGKKIICYMSIGEAEAQRFYWDEKWVRKGVPTAQAPSWLADLNGEGWEGNFKVRFWEPDWQSIIIDRPDSFLNRIIDAGFDGVYLDIIDAYDFWMDSDRGKARRPAADAEMVAFVQRIGRHARETRGVRDFAVVPQNGEPLLKFPEYRAAISAIGKEDILYRMDGQANKSPRVKQNSDQDIEVIMQHVRLALADRIPVLAVEYLRDRDEDKKFVALSRQRMREMGLVPHFGKRLLADLSPVEAAPDMAVS